MKVKFLLLALVASVANAKYGSIWIDDDEDTCMLQTAPIADDIMLLYKKAA